MLCEGITPGTFFRMKNMTPYDGETVMTKRKREIRERAQAEEERRSRMKPYTTNRKARRAAVRAKHTRGGGATGKGKESENHMSDSGHALMNRDGIQSRGMDMEEDMDMDMDTDVDMDGGHHQRMEIESIELSFRPRE